MSTVQKSQLRAAIAVRKGSTEPAPVEAIYYIYDGSTLLGTFATVKPIRASAVRSLLIAAGKCTADVTVTR